MNDFESEQKRIWELLSCLPSNSEDSDSEINFVSESEPSTGSEQEIEESKEYMQSFIYTGNSFIGKDGTVWKKEPPQKKSYTPVQSISGVNPPYKNLKTCIECFLTIFNDQIMQIMVQSTNTYISIVKNEFVRERDAQDTNEAELKALFGLLFYGGFLKTSYHSVKELWKTDTCGINLFQSTMSIKRFLFLLRCLRFEDENSLPSKEETDRLSPMRQVLELFVRNIQEVYSVSEYCTIGEKLEPFRGKCPFRQNVKGKCGIKILALCDSKTFYTYNFEIHAGHQPDGPYKYSNKAPDIVKRLIAPISGTRRNVTMDSWFMSIPLANDLLKNYNLTCVGALSSDKREIPLEFLPHKTRGINSSVFGFSDTGLTLVSYVLKRDKSMLVLSSLHEDDRIDPCSGEQLKPEIVTFYDSTRGCIDSMHELCGTYSVSRISSRWPLTVFYGLLNIAGINAFIIHRENNPELNLNRREFLKDLALALVKDHVNLRSNIPSLSRELKIGIKRLAEKEENSREQNFKKPTIQIEQDFEKPTGQTEQDFKKPTGRCVYCPRKDDKKTTSFCAECKKPVCKNHRHAVILCDRCYN